MEKLVKKLEKEVGLSEEQAIASVTIMKEYLDQQGASLDWEKFFKGKYNEYLNRGKQFIAGITGKVEGYSDQFTEKADQFSENVSDKLDNMTLDAKRKLRDATKKILDKLNEDKNL